MTKKIEPLAPEVEAQLLKAIDDADLAALQEVLRTGISVDAPLQREQGKTALRLTYGRNRTDPLTLALLEAGADFRKANVDLVWAVYIRNERAVKLLIERGADVNFKAPRSLGPPLRLAAAFDLHPIARMLIDAGADVNDGPLFAAVENQHPEMVKLLLQAGARVAEGNKILASAIQKGGEEMAVPLVQAARGNAAALNERADVGGWDPTQTNYQRLYDYATPLIIAAAMGQTRTVEALLAAGADVHLADKQGKTALAWAREKGHGAIAALLEKAETSQARTVDPDVDLMYAAEKGETPRVRELLSSGASVNARDVRPGSKGFTPLMLAARKGHVETVEALLAAGAELEARDDNEAESAGGFSFVLNEMGADGAMQAGFQMHRTALHWAAAEHAGVVEALLRREAQANAVDRAKWTPLMIAAEAGNEAAVAALLAAGADVAAKASKKRQALHLAAEEGRAAVARKLLAGGADPNAKDAEGDTALLAAARWARSDTVAALLEAGADVHAVNREKASALALLAGYQLRENKYIKGEGLKVVLKRPEEEILRTARLLVNAGGDPRQPDNDGRSALARAERGAKDHPLYTQLIAIYNEAAPRPAEAAAPAKKPPKPRAPRRKPVEEPAKAPDFSQAAQAPDYQKALAELEELCGAKRHPLEDVEGGFLFHVHSDKAGTVDFNATQERLLKAGCFIFRTEPGAGDAAEDGGSWGGSIGALPTRDPYDALLAMQTNGVNSDVMPQHIIAWFKETAQENPLVLTGVGHDFADARLLGKVRKPATLARRIARLCPDGDGEVEGLAEDLKTQGRIFLWWD